MKTNTLLIAAAAFAAGFYAKKLMEPATGTATDPARVGDSWNCQKNPNAPGCKGGNIHTIILPFTAKKQNANALLTRAGL